ncbi:sugar kinase [Roseibacterium sp. SDUM158017]|uniref:sugar kinase n=1 Tax=Roseicyclus salinarum TaxID=3036773 RepID=UPI002414EC98|nr:sugar kinase [Roseibacterium sp. SDUM158017]MDG4649925.1 sugar kinase [Roseibacterium sp. SDUM158017]
MLQGPVASIGECMIELSDLAADDGRIRMGFAGDTFNTAVYLARLVAQDGTGVSYVTALGQDAFSDRMIAAMRDEGIGTDLVVRLPDRLPGIYAIEVDDAGERSFRYWRDASAARALFSPEGLGAQALEGFGLVYLSGITLAILPEVDRAGLLERLRIHRDRGGDVAFDGNYRPRLWTSRDEARQWMAEALSAASIALPSVDDEMALFGDADEAAVLSRIAAHGPREIVLKRAERGPVVVADGARAAPDCPKAPKILDTTAAGDAFNAGYLAARLRGAPPEAAARSGHALAVQVIGHRGAIMPRDVPLAR